MERSPTSATGTAWERTPRRAVQRATWEALRRLEKKSEPAPHATILVLPMQLHLGDRITDETGEWEVVSQPYTTAGGKNARVRVQRVGEPLWE